jgi:hypothetical protein
MIIGKWINAVPRITGWYWCVFRDSSGRDATMKVVYADCKHFGTTRNTTKVYYGDSLLTDFSNPWFMMIEEPHKPQQSIANMLASARPGWIDTGN